ncbi:MAG: c-type cytochrome [Marinibacterium sp.]
MKFVPFAAALALAGSIATTGLAEDGPSMQQKARSGEMAIIAINLGVLGGMAKGEIAYDPAQAQAAANSIAAIALINQEPLWPEGSDAFSTDHGRAKAEIWDNLDDFKSKWMAFGQASAAMQAAAGQGPQAVGAAMGGLGGSCKGCHEKYRAPKN